MITIFAARLKPFDDFCLCIYIYMYIHFAVSMCACSDDPLSGTCCLLSMPSAHCLGRCSTRYTEYMKYIDKYGDESSRQNPAVNVFAFHGCLLFSTICLLFTMNTPYIVYVLYNVCRVQLKTLGPPSLMHRRELAGTAV